ncbi:hypothetical protein DFH08DRAFT_1017855 [Mycena albidolilacea]|uniref:Uncharacterized protein n=1 Tax=Mycena albidolilacea TaxID=1033008 RepID=A0AAD7ELA7_9AGAR|nr:hypothetical protein DFH08DRAFT_1017855 [Mycena albidolilacea]
MTIICRSSADCLQMDRVIGRTNGIPFAPPAKFLEVLSCAAFDLETALQPEAANLHSKDMYNLARRGTIVICLRQCAQPYSSTEWLFFFHPLRVNGTSFSHCRAKIHLDSRLPRFTSLPPLRHLFHGTLHGRAQVHPDHYALHSRLPGASCCLEASERPTFPPLLDAERAVPSAAAGSPRACTYDASHPAACIAPRRLHRTPPPASIGRPFEDGRRCGRTHTCPFTIDPPAFRLLRRPSNRHCARSQRPHTIDPSPLCAVHSATTPRADSREATCPYRLFLSSPT